MAIIDMDDIVIYGAGGFGKEVACLVERINYPSPKWNLIGFLDDNPDLYGKTISHFGSCLGGLEYLNNYKSPLSVAIAIGNSIIVRRIVDSINNPNISYPNLIDVSFYLADKGTFSIGKGNIIQGPGAVSCDVSIGDFNILNGSVVIGHDSMIGSFNSLMPAVRVSGQVSIGNDNFFGVGSIILQRIKVGNHVRLGAGSVLMTKPQDGQLYIGNPAIKTVF